MQVQCGVRSGCGRAAVDQTTKSKHGWGIADSPPAFCLLQFHPLVSVEASAGTATAARLLRHAAFSRSRLPSYEAAQTRALQTSSPAARRRDATRALRLLLWRWTTRTPPSDLAGWMWRAARCLHQFAPAALHQQKQRPHPAARSSGRASAAEAESRAGAPAAGPAGLAGQANWSCSSSSRTLHVGPAPSAPAWAACRRPPRSPSTATPSARTDSLLTLHYADSDHGHDDDGRLHAHSADHEHQR